MEPWILCGHRVVRVGEESTGRGFAEEKDELDTCRRPGWHSRGSGGGGSRGACLCRE